MTLSEKAAYLRGLADGVGIDAATDTGRILKAVIDLLGDVAENVDDLAESQTALGDEVDELSVDLSMLEAKCDGEYGDDEDEDGDWDWDEDGCACCSGCGDAPLDLSGENDEPSDGSDPDEVEF